jgi:hypothetical protein
MADPTRPNTEIGHDGVPTSGMPRWVKVFGVIALALIVLLVILILTGGGGGHGPGRH